MVWQPKLSLIFLFVMLTPVFLRAEPGPTERYWLKIGAKNKVERTRVVETGASLEIAKDDYVIAIGDENQREQLEKMGMLQTSYPLSTAPFDFPQEDSQFHDYTEIVAELRKIASDHPNITQLTSIGKSVEGRDIWKIRISGDLKNASALPAAIFMGGHHAREHVSIEMPLFLARHLVEKHAAGDAEVTRLLSGRDVHIIPVVNPDGAEHDVSTGSYQYWRKNRGRNENGSFGTDLNRNYSYLWGMGGSSQNPDAETYMGTAPFSEPETRAIRDFVDAQTNATMLLSFHTFSELILYPWGGTDDPVADERDRSVFVTMAKTMAKWNNYAPMQSSELYIATGDTADWAYATHNIFAFTFELDPSDMFNGGFYPGQAILPEVFRKNLQPCLYMIEYADNPYRVLQSRSQTYGLRSPLLD